MRDSPKSVVEGSPPRTRAMPGEPGRCKIVESALRRPEPPSASSSLELSLYVHECPPSPVTDRPPPQCRFPRRRWLSTYLSLWGVDWFKGDGEEAGAPPH